MSSEETLIQVRRDKLQALGSTYPLATQGQHAVYEIRFVLDNFIWDLDKIGTDPKNLGLAIMLRGRITAFRKSGGITFIKMTDQTGSIQLMLCKSVLTNYDQLHLMDLGDIIEVVGPTCLSKTGEKSLLITEWRVLTKSLRPPPEKFVGIVDTELKYRKRYLDLMSSEESRARFIVRSHILQGIRSFMNGEDFMEVETSTLNAVSSGANAKPFITHHNALDTDLRLRIAPELYLKRLLVGGFERVYEIGRNYRNEGIDTKHNPEFTMMECYRAYGNFPQLITFTQALLRSVREYLLFHLPPHVCPFFQRWDEECPFTLEQFVEVPMVDAVSRACSKAGIILQLNGPTEIHNVQLALPSDNPRPAMIDTKAMWHAYDTAPNGGEAMAVLFEHVAEPFLTEDYRTADGSKSLPVFITEYPKSVCPLSRANDKNPEVCDRFELFVDGRELANAFQELNDPVEQAARFKQQLKNNKDPMDYDADYIEALEHGMPPCIGLGMGIERLCMLLTNTASIKDVILFPTLRPEK